MKNTQNPRPSVLNRIFSAVSAVCIVSLSGFLFAHGAIIYAVAVLLFGFYIRWFILFCAKQDRDFQAMQEQEEKERNEFFY
jgi:hypothetical protein